MMASADTYVVFPARTLKSAALYGSISVPIAVKHITERIDCSKKSPNTFDIRKWFATKSRRKEKELSSSPNALDDVRPYLEDDFAQERIIDVDMSPRVTLPPGVDYNEWLAAHTISFFEHINLLYGCMSEFCLSTGCITMTGPGQIQYQWVDDRGKKCKCTAPQYIDYVMAFSQKCIYDETVFPTKYGQVFPNSFEATVKKIHRLLLHVLAHLYHSHSSELLGLKLHGHINTLTYHFLLFNKQFTLIDDKDMEILDDLFDRLQFYATRKVQFDSGSCTRSTDDMTTGVSTPSPCRADMCTDTTQCEGVTEENKENIACAKSPHDGFTPVALVT